MTQNSRIIFFMSTSQEKSLFKKIQQSSDWTSVRRSVKGFPNIQNVRDARGRTVLHIAAETGNLQLTLLLLSNRRIDANATDEDGWTPLHCAASAGHFDICAALLTKRTNLNINIKNEDGNTALKYLTRLSSKYVNDKTLKAYLKVLSLMVERGADVKATNRQGEAPLHSACQQGTIHGIQFLLQNGARVNQLNLKKESALHYAMRRPVFEVIKVLVEYGADPFLASESGGTPMGLAMLERNDKDITSIMNSRALFCKEAIREHANAGNLERHIRKSKWEKVYCVLKETIFFVYRNNDAKEKPISSYDICEFQIVEKVPDKGRFGRSFVFMLEGKNRVSTFAAYTELEHFGWVKSMSSARQIKAHMLQQDIELTVESNVDAPGKKKDLKKKSHSKRSAMETEEINQNLIRALEDPGNSFCADCNSREPYWMLVEYGALVCYECATIHTRLETCAIKSVHYDSWLLSDSMKLKSNGNTNHNTKREAQMPFLQKPTPSSSVEEKEKFIKLKYSKKEGSQSTKASTKEQHNQVTATAARVSKYKQIYFINQLLQSLSIPRSMWKALKSSSSVYDKISKAMDQGKEFDELFIGSLSETLDPVSGYANKLLTTMIPFVRLIKQWKTENCVKEAESLLLEILNSYNELQNEIFDLHVQTIFKWWIPQAIEVLTTIKGTMEKGLVCTESKFVNNSIKALFLLTGEYLIFESDAWPKNSDDGNREEQFKEIQEKCRSHTIALRQLIDNAFKCAIKNNGSDGSLSQSVSEDHRSSSSKSILRMNSLDLKRTSSYTWSQTSTGDQSPREQSESFLQEDSQVEYPLVTFLNQMPFASVNILCELVAKIPEDLQKDLLGLVCTGHSFIEIQRTANEDVFSSSQPTMESVLTAIHNHIETLRYVWPDIPREKELDPTVTDQMLRQVFILKRHLRLLYGLSVPWTVPEVWQMWRNLQTISTDVTEFLIFSAKSNTDHRMVSEILCTLLVQARWTISKLKEIQNFDSCAT